MYTCADCTGRFCAHSECVLSVLCAINTSSEEIGGDDLYNDIDDDYNTNPNPNPNPSPANGGGTGGGGGTYEKPEWGGASTGIGRNVSLSPFRPKEPKPSFNRLGAN